MITLFGMKIKHMDFMNLHMSRSCGGIHLTMWNRRDLHDTDSFLSTYYYKDLDKYKGGKLNVKGVMEMFIAFCFCPVLKRLFPQACVLHQTAPRAICQPLGNIFHTEPNVSCRLILLLSSIVSKKT